MPGRSRARSFTGRLPFLALAVAIIGCGGGEGDPNTAGYAVLGDSFFGAISAHLP